MNLRRGSFELNKELIETAEETYMEFIIPKKKMIVIKCTKKASMF